MIRDAGDLNLGGLAKRIADLADRTRTNKISPDELSGAHIHGDQHGQPWRAVRHADHQPAPGRHSGHRRGRKRAVVVNDPDLGEIIATRSMVYLALSYDHRLVDGAEAARFLTTVKDRLEAGNFQPDLGL